MSNENATVTNADELYGAKRTLPTALRVHRTAAGLTQAELAEVAGCTRVTVSLLERRSHEPSLKTATALAQALNCPVESIFPTHDEDPAATGSPVKTLTDIGGKALEKA